MSNKGSVPSAGPRQLPSGKLCSSLPASQHSWRRMAFTCAQKLGPALKCDLRSSTNKHQHALRLSSARARGRGQSTHPTGRSVPGWLITEWPQAPTLHGFGGPGLDANVHTHQLLNPETTEGSAFLLAFESLAF